MEIGCREFHDIIIKFKPGFTESTVDSDSKRERHVSLDIGLTYTLAWHWMRTWFIGSESVSVSGMKLMIVRWLTITSGFCLNIRPTKSWSEGKRYIAKGKRQVFRKDWCPVGISKTFEKDQTHRQTTRVTRHELIWDELC